MTDCPCSSGLDYEKCCGPLHRGTRVARTAAELMRARYSAYALGELDFLVESTHPSNRKEIDRNAMRAWSRESTWNGLEILGTDGGAEDDDLGHVEFKVRYSRDAEEHEHHEIAEFRKHDGAWRFVDGKPGGVKTFVRTEPKVGRNDPCPCGSGKKYKKCCGAKSSQA